MVQIEKRPVLRQMDPFFRNALFYYTKFFSYNGRHSAVEYGPIIRQGDMDIGALIVQRINQSCRHICKPAGFGIQTIGGSPHTMGKIGDLRGHQQNPGIC